MKHVLLKNVDGSVQVMILVPREDGTYSTPEIELSKWTSQKRNEVSSWREIKPEHVPQDRTFRNAWCDVTDSPMVDVDMPKARNIHRDRLREIRKPKLEVLDIEAWRAFGDPSKMAQVEAKKQYWRDLPRHPAIEAAQTPDELVKVVPVNLGDRIFSE